MQDMAHERPHLQARGWGSEWAE